MMEILNGMGELETYFVTKNKVGSSICNRV